MKLIYTGPLPNGTIQVDLEKEIAFTRGVPVEVPDEIGRKLRPADEWKEHREKKEKE